MGKTPKHTDGYLNADGHLVIPFPNAVKAIQDGLPMTIWVKEGNSKGKLLNIIKIPAK